MDKRVNTTCPLDSLGCTKELPSPQNVSLLYIWIRTLLKTYSITFTSTHNFCLHINQNEMLWNINIGNYDVNNVLQNVL